MSFKQEAGKTSAATLSESVGLVLGKASLILNPGSVGQPRDRDPRSSYMLIDTSAGVATWNRVEYDVAATQAAILAAGLPPRLARRLSSGS